MSAFASRTATAGSLLALAACASVTNATPPPPEPSAYAVVRMAFALRDVALSAHPSCAQAAPAAPADSIGDYLAGFLAAMADGTNRVVTNCDTDDAGRQRCELWLKHADEEDEWAWGIDFAVGRDGRPDATTVRCLGSG